MLGLSFLLQYDKELENFQDKYEHGAELGIGQILSMIKDAVVFATPIDVATKKGKKKEFDEHIQHSWVFEMEASGKGATVSTDSPYGPVLEEGLYPGLGPRTVASGAGIFSRMAPKGILKPIVEDKKIFDDAISAALAQLNERGEQMVVGA